MAGESVGNEAYMLISEAEQHVARLGTVSADLDQAWSTSAGRLAAGIGQLGAGPMGQRFLASYQPVDTQLRGAANEAVERAGRLSDAGQQGIGVYSAGSDAATTAMNQVGGDF